MIKKYNDFLLEFNRKDINLITSEEISEKFTIAFEIEIETDDKNITPPNLIDEQKLLDEIRSSLFINLDYKNVHYSNHLDFIDNILKQINFDDEHKIVDKLLNVDNYDNNTEKIIINFIKSPYQDICDKLDIETESDDLDFKSDQETYLKELKNKVKKYLPNFYNKHKNDLDFVIDLTLDRGFEIKQKSYIKGINNAILFLYDFFNEFNNQSYWKFTEKTGLHINIGYDKKDLQWNIVKGMILLKDLKKDNIPFVFKDMIWRMNTRFTNSIFSKLELDKTKIDLSNLKETENYINDIIEDIFKKYGSKHFGFNISRIKTDNYVEFRYVGGIIDKDLIIHKLLYFCYIVYLMTNPNYKRREYLKSLYKFIYD